LVVAQWGQAYVELSLLSLLVAWCCSEIIRYSFFAFKVRLWQGAATAHAHPRLLQRDRQLRGP
jgi:hypothetical protein